MGMNGFGGEGLKRAKAGAEEAPADTVPGIASILEGMKARTAQAEVLPAIPEGSVPGELDPQQAEILNKTVHGVIHKNRKS